VVSEGRGKERERRGKKRKLIFISNLPAIQEGSRSERREKEKRGHAASCEKKRETHRRGGGTLDLFLLRKEWKKGKRRGSSAASEKQVRREVMRSSKGKRTEKINERKIRKGVSRSAGKRRRKKQTALSHDGGGTSTGAFEKGGVHEREKKRASAESKGEPY